MNTARASGSLALAVLAALASPRAVADDFGWYGGVSVGQSRATIDDDRIISDLLSRGFVTTSLDGGNASDTGYKLFGGYRFNRNFALEGGYFKLGEFSYLATTLPLGSLAGNVEFQGVNLDLLGIWPITDRFSAFGRVGATYVEAKARFVGSGAVLLTPAVTEPEERGANYKIGVGLQYDFSQSLALRLEAERYRVDDSIGNEGDVDLYSLGLVFGFGGRSVAPEVVAPVVAQKTCADLDDDGDGINNCNDKCPGSAAGQAIGADGCPLPAPEPEPVVEPKPFRG